MKAAQAFAVVLSAFALADGTDAFSMGPIVPNVCDRAGVICALRASAEPHTASPIMARHTASPIMALRASAEPQLQRRQFAQIVLGASVAGLFAAPHAAGAIDFRKMITGEEGKVPVHALFI
jgi:NAD(P)-dependent dehydrogenase (short-subunit alcohol dehydrogenase family)